MESGLSSPILRQERAPSKPRRTLTQTPPRPQGRRAPIDLKTGPQQNLDVEQTFAYPTWLFTRALCLIYLVAFLSLMTEGKGLWGANGVLPIRDYMKAMDQTEDPARHWKAPAIFWLSTSDDMIKGVAITGAVAAIAAFVGFAQGWCLLLCFGMYLSLASFGQQFMAFQWDSLLLEVGFLILFVVPWNLEFTMLRAVEPHWVIRGMFGVVLFKLMFLSGVSKLASGDESWRDLTALTYHFWTQPLPNPLSLFFHSLPEFVHRINAVIMFGIELIVPFFIFWPRARAWAGLAFILLSASILLTGNFAFFNWLTIALCFWIIPDSFWEKPFRLMPFKLELVTAPMFPHPFFTVTMGCLALLSLVWCVRFMIPDFLFETMRPVLQYAQAFRISSPYGLFATMTKQRHEIVLEGSLDGSSWKEYEFKFKPGNVYRMPPVLAPFHARLDWQMWFAALGTLNDSPWLQTFMKRLLENRAEVTELLETNPFPDTPPKFLRAKLYNYEFTSPEEALNNDIWWKRTPIGDYSPILTHP